MGKMREEYEQALAHQKRMKEMKETAPPAKRDYQPEMSKPIYENYEDKRKANESAYESAKRSIKSEATKSTQKEDYDAYHGDLEAAYRKKHK